VNLRESYKKLRQILRSVENRATGAHTLLSWLWVVCISRCWS